MQSASGIDGNDEIRVENFAKDTGDFTGLSAVDLKVIAYGVKIATEKGERAKINLTPQSLSEFKPKAFKPFYDEVESDDSEDEKATKADNNDDGWNTTEAKPKKHASTHDEFQDVANPRRKEIRNHEMAKYQKKIEEAKLLMAEEAGNVDQVKQEMQAEKAALEEA